MIELASEAGISNPVIKAVVFVGLQKMTQEDVIKLSNLALVALQYIEKGETDKLSALIQRAGVPASFAQIINQYASNIVKQ